MEKNTKACPFCWEEILKTAKKCKHCWEFLKTEEEIEEENNFKPLVYWKNKAIKILSWIVFWILGISFIFIWIGVNSSTNTKEVQKTEWTWEVVENVNIPQEQQSTPWGFFIFIWLLWFIPIWQLYMKKLIINKDHVTIKSWIIFKKSEDIKYKKINNIGKSSFLGFWWVKIFTWNDKPVVFDNLEDYEVVIDKINAKIDK